MKRPLLLVNLTGLVVGFSYGLHGPVLPVFAKNVAGATYADLGLVGVANFLPYMAIPLLVGILLDRFNGGRMLAIGIALNTVSVYLLSMAESVPDIIMLRVMNGVAHAFFWPPCESIISDHSGQGERVKNISRFTMFFVTGFMVGPLAGAWMLDGMNATYVALFQVTALVMAAGLISSVMVSKHHVQRLHKRFEISSLREIMRFPAVVVVLMFCTASFGIMLSVYPAHLNDRGIGESGILVLYFVFGIARVSALAVAGTLARYSRAVLAVGVAGVAAGFAVSAFAESFALFLVALIMMGFVLSIFFPLTLEAVLSRTKTRATGRIIGAYETLFGVGWVIGPAVGGVVVETFGDVALYVGLCVAGLAVAAFTAVYGDNVKSHHRSHGVQRSL